MSRPLLITFQGQARSGKGTASRAVADYFESIGKKVLRVDQGVVFRTMARLLVDEPESQRAVTLETEAFRRHLTSSLLAVYNDPSELRELYTPEIQAASHEVGRLPASQFVAVSMLESSLVAARDDYDVFVVDGRALHEIGVRLAEDGVVDYVLAFDFYCDARVSAEREFGRQYGHEPGPADQELLAELQRAVEARNVADASREAYPSLPLEDTYRFAPSGPGEDIDAFLATIPLGEQPVRVTIDNSYPHPPSVVADTAVAIARHIVDAS